MREKMPWCAAIVDELRDVFGVGEMNHVIRDGLRADCEPRFRVHFMEAGHVLGAPFDPPAGKVVSAAQMVIGDQSGVPKRGRQ